METNTIVSAIKKGEILVVLSSISLIISTFTYDDPNLSKVFLYSSISSSFFIFSFIGYFFESLFKRHIIESSKEKLVKPEDIVKVIKDINSNEPILIILRYTIIFLVGVGLLHLLLTVFELSYIRISLFTFVKEWLLFSVIALLLLGFHRIIKRRQEISRESFIFSWLIIGWVWISFINFISSNYLNFDLSYTAIFNFYWLHIIPISALLLLFSILRKEIKKGIHKPTSSYFVIFFYIPIGGLAAYIVLVQTDWINFL